MNKLIGNIRITPNPGSGGGVAHFEVVFVPFHGKVNAQTVRIANQDDLTAFLIEIKISEDDASRWSGRARAGVVLIPNIERPEDLLREKGLLQ